MKNIFKRILCAVFVLVFMLANANIALAADVIEVKPKMVSPTLYASSEAVESASSLPIDVDEFQSYLLEQLKVLPADEECVVEIDISRYNIPYTDENYQALLNLIWYESPELFRAQSLGVGGYDIFNTLYVECVADFCDPRYFAECSDLMESVVDDFVSDIKDNSGLTDVEKALILHDRLATYCEYDFDNYNNNTLPRVSYTAYGILGLGTGVCMGYTLAYDYLLEQVGIKSDYCSSEELNHAWNIVYINNIPYHVDVTWDDPTRDVSGGVYHDNFLRSTNGIIETGHDASDFITTPVDTTYDDYFWQDSATAFQVIDNTIYYVDNCLRDTTQSIKIGKLIALNGINDATPEVLKELSYTWYYDKTEGTYWPDNYTRLGCIRDLLYYSTPESVCSYNPATKETKELITAEDIVTNYGDANLSVFGLTAYKCTYWGEYSNTPGYSATTKEKYFTGANHNPTENWKVVIEPTYSSEGKEKNYCIDCGAELGSRIIPVLIVHNWGEWYIDPNNKPTCTEKGVKLRNCQDAGCDVYEWDYADALGHTESDEWITDRVATCSETGYMHKICTVCFETIKGQELPKGECSRFSTSGYTAVCCLTDGYTGDRTCLDCGTVYKGETVKATGHNQKLVNVKNATCEKNGYTGDMQCMNCGEILSKGEETPALGHKMSDWVVIKTPTSTEKGLKQKKCETCGFGVTDVIPMIITLNIPSVSTENTAKGINVFWNAIENAQSYDIYRRQYNASTKKWSGWSKIQTGYTETNYVDGTVVLGTNYRYTVRAVNGTVMSSYTSSATIKYNVTPTVKVANATNGVKVAWSTVANATGYTVYRSTYSNGKWSGWKNMGTAKANKTAWVDKNVKTGVAYKYTVRAAYGKILSSYNKSGASVVFLNTPAVKIANNATGMKVAWSKVAGATGYVIYSSQYDPATNSWSKWSNRGAVNTNSWIDTAVQSGVTYKYTVRALNGKSLSAYVSSGALMYLAQPTVKIANAQAGINVSWSQSAGALGYTVYRSEYDAKTKKWSSWKNRGTATADKSSWVDKKVASGKYYKYTVRAINGNAKSTFVSTGGMIFLAQPTITVSKDINSNVISWNTVNGATGYRVFRKANGETNWSIVATVKNTSCSDTNINDESTYTYTVRAYKGKVWSSYDINGVTINRNYKQAVFDLVNIERAKAGLSPLEYYTDGQLAADIRTNEITQKFAHERPNGTLCFTVFQEQGISYYSAGENIAWGYHTPEAVMCGWMNSEGHKANILNSSYTHLIVGYDANTNSWVQLFLGNPYVQ